MMNRRRRIFLVRANTKSAETESHNCGCSTCCIHLAPQDEDTFCQTICKKNRVLIPSPGCHNCGCSTTCWCCVHLAQQEEDTFCQTISKKNRVLIPKLGWNTYSRFMANGHERLRCACGCLACFGCLAFFARSRREEECCRGIQVETSLQPPVRVAQKSHPPTQGRWVKSDVGRSVYNVNLVRFEPYSCKKNRVLIPNLGQLFSIQGERA